MSAVAVQFDPAFTMGPRSVLGWPGPLEAGSSSNTSVFGTDLNSALGGSEPSLSPPSETKSLAPSPLRGTLRPEQLELKRQGDRARRDSKLSARIQRVSSNLYAASPPMAMGDVASAINMPSFSKAPCAIPLMATPAAALNGQPYLPTFNAALQHQSQGGHVFAPPYPQPLQPSYDVSMEYPAVYGGPGEYTSGWITSVPVSPDAGMLYQMPPAMAATQSSVSVQESSTSVRVVQSRPKPRCWEHGCNGRQFSTFSNLLRHQREKSGQSAKATCPNCGAEFTRTTARNGHLLHEKCKRRRNT